MNPKTLEQLEELMLTGINLTGTWPSNTSEFFGLPDGRILLVKHHSGTPIGKMQHRVSWSYKLYDTRIPYENYANMGSYRGDVFPGKKYKTPIYEYVNGEWIYDKKEWENLGQYGYLYKSGQYYDPNYRYNSYDEKEWTRVE